MSCQLVSPVPACNNDRVGHMAAFRVPARATAPVAGSGRGLSHTVAAPALVGVPPRPTRLDDAQAAEALQAVQQAAGQGGDSLGAVHAGLNPERVARLLGLLE